MSDIKIMLWIIARMAPLTELAPVSDWQTVSALRLSLKHDARGMVSVLIHSVRINGILGLQHKVSEQY